MLTIFPLAIIAAAVHMVLAIPRRAGEFDERDRLVDLRSEWLGGTVLTAGVLGALAAAMSELASFWVAHILLSALVLAELAKDAARSMARDLTVAKPTHVTNDIRRLRFAADEMNQAELARRVGVTGQTVIAIEQGRYSPSVEVAFKMARELGVSLETAFHDPEDWPVPSVSGAPEAGAVRSGHRCHVNAGDRLVEHHVELGVALLRGQSFCECPAETGHHPRIACQTLVGLIT